MVQHWVPVGKRRFSFSPFGKPPVLIHEAIGGLDLCAKARPSYQSSNLNPSCLVRTIDPSSVSNSGTSCVTRKSLAEKVQLTREKQSTGTIEARTFAVERPKGMIKCLCRVCRGQGVRRSYATLSRLDFTQNVVSPQESAYASTQDILIGMLKRGLMPCIRHQNVYASLQNLGFCSRWTAIGHRSSGVLDLAQLALHSLAVPKVQ